MSVTEAARMLGVHYRSLPRWIKQYKKEAGITIEGKKNKKTNNLGINKEQEVKPIPHLTQNPKRES